jgi:hypothetical protein
MNSPPALLVATDNQGDNIRVDVWLYFIKGISGSTSRKGYVPSVWIAKCYLKTLRSTREVYLTPRLFR